ncbi:MAG: hypothetical protein EZS28_011999 [Streblomastix strix]|uniref:Uncharacterized protein n=1 Tax=Streblomastix strix TaxID=222440 RepID=A0A5J4WC03_9EUKA|nr:MAG: hypothetical protein EZS28_011999 [Streblomastix strix]
MIHPGIEGALGAGANLAGAVKRGNSSGGIMSNEDSAEGDFAFSAESGTVWMYDQNWYNSGDIVPDQVTPASDAIPQLSIVSGNAGVSIEYARGDHKHPLQVSTVLPAKDTAVGEEGVANTYARSDHTHHVNLGNSVPKKDTRSGTAGSANIYSSATHQHLLNIDPTTANLPLVNATAAANGTSDYYCRNDKVHPQQLTYDGNVTATKFIKIGGLASEILCANGDTTTIDSKFSRTYNGSAGGWIRLCVFPAGASVAPTRVINSYNIENGENQIFHNHSGSGTQAVYAAYIRLKSAGTITIVVSDQSTYYTNRITEILTQDVVSGVSNGTQIPIAYDLANGGIINNMLQVNPMNRSYTTYNNGIRIGNYSNESALYLGCSTSAINTTKAGQWEISKTVDNTLTINPSSLRQADHSVGLSINSKSSIIKFNGNELVNVGTYQMISGLKTFTGVNSGNMQINPIATNFDDGLRISRMEESTGSSAIFLGCSRSSNTGVIAGQWSIFTPPSNYVNNPLGFVIVLASEASDNTRGLRISAEGNTLTFNGSVIAGTGATNGATNGSVNYSAGNPILWGENSTDTIGGFYSDGAKVYWRAHPLTMGSVPP